MCANFYKHAQHTRKQRQQGESEREKELPRTRGCLNGVQRFARKLKIKEGAHNFQFSHSVKSAEK